MRPRRLFVTCWPTTSSVTRARVSGEVFLKERKPGRMVDGEHVLPMATSLDPNGSARVTPAQTQAAWAFTSFRVVTDAVHARVMEQVILHRKSMAAEGNSTRAFYAGLMIDADGNPSVIEYNCRFGDPETQPIVHRPQSDLAALCLAALDHTLDQHTAQWDWPAVGVALAGGHP